MTITPERPTWVPSNVNFKTVSTCSMAMQNLAMTSGFSREVYFIAIAQMAEAIAGYDASDDADVEVLRFVAYRLRAVADAIDKSAN